MVLAERYDAFLLDLDGVLYRGDEAIPGAVEAVARLRQGGRAVVFMTNNSARTPGRIAEHLTQMGFAAGARDVVTSAQVTADVIAGRGGGSAFVIGEEGVREALVSCGIDVLDDEPERADHVIVGWDRRVTYAKLRTACLLVERGAGLIATNADASYPAADGLWPGTGALLAVITTTTGADPEVVGKPNAPMFDAARRRAGASSPLVIGDRLDTDVMGAAALGIDSMLVLTGVTRADEVPTDAAPTYVAQDLGSLFAHPGPERRTAQSK